MWDRLRKHVSVEREQLNRLVEVHRPVLDKCDSVAPSNIELSAMASMLHSFYTGIENIFKRIALETDGCLPSSSTWHRDLLDTMTRRTEDRPEVVSEALRESLREYLEFRHVFRQAYSFELRWDKMSRLVLDCEKTLRQLEEELDTFLDLGHSDD